MVWCCRGSRTVICRVARWSVMRVSAVLCAVGLYSLLRPFVGEQMIDSKSVCNYKVTITKVTLVARVSWCNLEVIGKVIN